jgi:hypothetical protein
VGTNILDRLNVGDEGVQGKKLVGNIKTDCEDWFRLKE